MEAMKTELNRDIIINYLYPDLESEELHSIEEEMFENFDPAEIFRAHKDDLSDLMSCIKMLEDMNAENDPEKHGRAYSEYHYILLMDILFHMARRFHPLSEHGREMLHKAIEYRKEFEKKQ